MKKSQPSGSASPLVSIGLPVHNGAHFLRQAIDSILQQDFTDLELIVCDNASTDDTVAIVEEYAAADSRVRCYRNETDLGAAKNFSRVFAIAQGKYFKWAAHDDWISKDFLQKCVNELNAHPESVLCYPAMQVTELNGTERHIRDESLGITDQVHLFRRFHTYIWRYFDPTRPVFGLIRADALRQTGLIRNCPEPDRVLLGELALLGTFREIPEPLFHRRMRTQHYTHNTWTWLDSSNTKRRKSAARRMMSCHINAIAKTETNHFKKAMMVSDFCIAFSTQRIQGKYRSIRRQHRQRHDATSA